MAVPAAQVRECSGVTRAALAWPSRLSCRLPQSLTLMSPVLFACQTLRAAGSFRAAGRGKLTIRAARVAGVEIPNQKRLETALTCACAARPLHL